MGGAAAGQVVHRLGDALQDGAVGLGLTEALHQLVADVAGSEVREHQHVCRPGNRRIGGLELGHLGNDGGIELQVSVDSDLGCLLLAEGNGFLHLLGGIAAGRPHRGIGEERYLGLDLAHEGLPGVGGGDGDLGELIGGGGDVEAAVGEDHGAVGAEVRRLGAHDHEGAHELGAGGGLQDLKGGAQRIGGRMARARDEAVGVAHLHHHGAVVGVIHDLRAGLLDGDPLLRAKLGELLRIGLMLGGRGALGVDDLRAGHVDLGGVAQDHDIGQALRDDLLGGLDGARVLALGQHDGLQILLRRLLHAV